MWAALIAALLGGGGEILGSILSNERAKDVQEEGQQRFEYGKTGMESLLTARQQNYNDIWKMIYGGVENFDFNDISTPSGGSGGAPTRGGTNPNDPRDKEGRPWEYGKPRPESRSGYSKTGSKVNENKGSNTHSRSTSITGS